MTDEVFKGRLWVIADEDGKLIDDIDTDQIFHNSHLAITEIKEMGQYAFGNLDGWKHFAREARPGDMVMVGANFGSGSSRQQAVDCFVALSVSCVIAESYGAIYKRNAINSGFPILTIRRVNTVDDSAGDRLKNGDEVEVDLASGVIKNGGKNVGELAPMSKVQMDIYRAGNLFEFAKDI